MTREERIIQDLQFLVVGDLCDPKTIRHYNLAHTTKGEYVSRDGGYFIKEFCWPVGAKEELIDLCEHRQKLKKALDDSMSLVYQLSNKYSDGGPK